MTYKFSGNLKATKTCHFISAREEITLTVFEKKEFTVLLETKVQESCLCPLLRGVWGNADIDTEILSF